MDSEAAAYLAYQNEYEQPDGLSSGEAGSGHGRAEAAHSGELDSEGYGLGLPHMARGAQAQFVREGKAQYLVHNGRLVHPEALAGLAGGLEQLELYGQQPGSEFDPLLAIQAINLENSQNIVYEEQQAVFPAIALPLYNHGTGLVKPF